LSQPFRPGSNRPSTPYVRVNGKIRAREVRVVDSEGAQMGILSIGDALTLARGRGVDLVEIAPNAEPPVCRLVDYGKYRYEQSKKEKESRKHQHASMVKEIQLRPAIDPHDLGVKVGHAIDFLCEDMKVKVALRFRGRELAHTDIGFQVVRSFVEKVAAYGHPDFEPKLNGKTIVLMVSPLPKNKRARHPDASSSGEGAAPASKPKPSAPPVATSPAAPASASGFTNSPFSELGANRS
jgi:translation initiation factor IF-3